MSHADRHGISHEKQDEVTTDSLNIVRLKPAKNGYTDRIYEKDCVEVRVRVDPAGKEVVGTAFENTSEGKRNKS